MKRLTCTFSIVSLLLLLVFTQSLASPCKRVYGPPHLHSISTTTTIPTGLTVSYGQIESYNMAPGAPPATGLIINGDLVIDGGVLNIELDGLVVYGNIYVKNCGILNINHSSPSGNCNFNGSHIYILPSAKMSINNTFMNMCASSYIAVESDYINSGAAPRVGGILQLENVNFTHQSGSNWYGICVAGGNGQSLAGSRYSSAGTSQYFSQNKIPLTHDIYVGQLLANNVLFEGMVYGVTNFDKYGDYTVGNYGDLLGQYSGGGLIQCKNVTFRGNYLDVLSFYNYKNWQPKTSTNITYTSANSFIKDKSYIRESYFNNLYNSGTYTNRFINLYQTDGVSILGCEFLDDATYAGPNIAAVDGYESNITITSSCYDPSLVSPYGCPHLTRSHFADMRKYGVELNSSNGSHITGCDFTGSYGIRGVGIDMHNCLHDVILNNKIDVKNTSGISPANVVGISMEGCKSFWLEGNLVRYIGTPPTGTYAMGIVVNETGGSWETVYRNIVKYMDYEMQANGVNYVAHHGDGGLKYICNDMQSYGSNICTDILVHDIKGSGISGIYPVQAIETPTGFISSGNTFASTKIAPGFRLFNPTPNYTIQYYWNASGEEPLLNNNINAVFTPNTKSCPNNTICCSVLEANSTSVIPTTGYTSYDSYHFRKTLLESMIDTADTSGSVYPVLLSQYNMLVDTMVRTFLYAADSMMQYKGDSFFMEYKIDTLRDTVNQVYYYDTTVRFVDISVPLNYDSIIMVLDSARYFPQFKLRLAAMYKHNRDFTSAIATLNQISSNYSLSNYELRDISNTIYLYSLEDSLYKKGNSFDSLSSTDTTLIGSIARDSIGTARYIAQGILSRYDTTYFWPDVYTLPDTGNKGAMPSVTIANADIQLSPNPVKNILNITLHNYKDGMSAVITDINGKKVVTEILNGNGNTVISTAALSNGVYFVQILKYDKVKDVFKIIKN